METYRSPPPQNRCIIYRLSAAGAVVSCQRPVLGEAMHPSLVFHNRYIKGDLVKRCFSSLSTTHFVKVTARSEVGRLWGGVRRPWRIPGLGINMRTCWAGALPLWKCLARPALRFKVVPVVLRHLPVSTRRMPSRPSHPTRTDNVTGDTQVSIRMVFDALPRKTGKIARINWVREIPVLSGTQSIGRHSRALDVSSSEKCWTRVGCLRCVPSVPTL
ncbi:hypothetical protein BDZ89DRAFT_188342 [Hymenopellis radicata]|nr:hypothetical protein BDZ89DRAFT_188342 [Hymenopellis radicata]